uniref:Uncharacterized protein n=1 Tax=Tanacetum cinerariifolium TaxID=118510 RepID=A0A699JZ40_TANCI|nr:hypothetical protein [Tanacetum cinerariifolium]
MRWRDPVNEHVFGRKHDDFAKGEHRDSQRPVQHRGRHRKPHHAHQEQAEPCGQPLVEVLMADALADHVLRQVGRELTEHHGAEHTADGETDQAMILEQNAPHRDEGNRPIGRVRRTQLAVTVKRVDKEETESQQRGHDERQLHVPVRQAGANEGPDRIANIDQRVAHREHLALLAHRQQLAEGGLDHDINHRVREIERHQKQKEQPEFAGHAHADKAGHKEPGEAQNQAITGQFVGEITAIQAQQRTDDQRTADDHADVAHAQDEVGGQVDHQIGQRNGPSQRQKKRRRKQEID